MAYFTRFGSLPHGRACKPQAIGTTARLSSPAALGEIRVQEQRLARLEARLEQGMRRAGCNSRRNISSSIALSFLVSSFSNLRRGSRKHHKPCSLGVLGLEQGRQSTRNQHRSNDTARSDLESHRCGRSRCARRPHRLGLDRTHDRLMVLFGVPRAPVVALPLGFGCPALAPFLTKRRTLATEIPNRSAALERDIPPSTARTTLAALCCGGNLTAAGLNEVAGCRALWQWCG